MNKETTRLVSVLVLLTVVITGCEKRQASEPAPKTAENIPVLKQFIGRTDIVIVKHFFKPLDLVSADRQEFISPCHVALGALVAYEPGKESGRLKGVRVGVTSTYVKENAYSHPDEHVSFLDESEARDMAAALNYLKQVNGEWAATQPSDDVEVMFASKDDFQFSLLPDAKKGNLLYFQSGNASCALSITALDELQKGLDSVLRTLKNNEK